MAPRQEYTGEENGYFSFPLRFLFYTLFSFISGSICYHYGMHFYIDSDEANYYLAAQDMAHGNFTLKGWVFSPDNFWLIDILGMATLIKFGGLGITAPHLMAAIWWAGVTFCALCLANPPQKTWSWVRCLPVILFIAFPPLYEHRPSGFITFVPYHVGTLFYGLCGLVAAQMISIRKNSVINYLLLGITALPIFTSDFFGVVFYVMPLVFVSLLFRLKGENTVPPKGLITAFGIAFIISEFIKIYVHHNDGFIAHTLHSKFISIEEMPSKIIYTMKSVFDFFGVDFFGHKVGSAIPDLIKLIPFLVFCLFLYKKIKTRKAYCLIGFDYISSSLFLGGTIIFFASLFSDFSLYKEDIIRYFLPFFVFYILIYTRNAQINKFLFLVPCFLISIVYISTWGTITKTKSSFKDIFGVHHQMDTAYIEEKLKENNLRLGYAGYWEASVVTANSQGRFLSRAIKVSEREVSNSPLGHDQCQLSPYVWISKLDWYKKSNFENEKQIFFITHIYGEEHDSWLLQDRVINNLGQPDKIIPLGDNLAIDVYNTERVFACQSLYTWEKHGKRVDL
ncbi:hypothetical protein [Acetobacter orientalis]|uniref:hypothetical protein n=2 Tax=Acetobacter orientalis TaxID=146474 RepID=UPI0039EA4412